MYIRDNLLYINEKIEKALERSNRQHHVELIAVTKTVDTDRIKQVLEYGVKSIGENKVQELETKFHELGDGVNYHMIGYLQSNKVRNIIDKVSLVHSLDRTSLAKELDKRAKINNVTIDALIQVNVAEEASKSGLKVSEVMPFLEEILKYENIRIKGLMTIAPLTDDNKLLRNIFKTMSNLQLDITDRKYKNVYMDFLSMGMTNDYEIAIEEGANMVRIGTGIFGNRNY